MIIREFCQFMLLQSAGVEITNTIFIIAVVFGTDQWCGCWLFKESYTFILFTCHYHHYHYHPCSHFHPQTLFLPSRFQMNSSFIEMLIYLEWNRTRGMEELRLWGNLNTCQHSLQILYRGILSSFLLYCDQRKGWNFANK